MSEARPANAPQAAGAGSEREAAHAGEAPPCEPPAPLRWPLEIAGVVLLALLTWAWAPHPLALDATDVTSSLIWGKQIADGDLPSYGAAFALTPHPLHVAFAAVFAPFGDGTAESAMRALAFLSFGGLAWALWRLGQACSSTAVGVLAALLVLTNPAELLGNGTVDLPFVALIAWAAVLEARRSRRGTPVLALLALAGLLRPEAWLLAAAYAVWLAPRERRGQVKAAAWVAAAPLVWALGDLLVAGDPLHSLTHTRDVAREIGRRTGLSQTPGALVDGLRSLLRPAELAGGAAGLVLALRAPRGPLRVAAAPVVLGVAGFVALGVAGLPLNARYLLLPTAFLLVLAAHAALGWLGRPAGSPRRVWAAGAAVLAILALAVVPREASKARDLRADLRAQGVVQRDLERLLHSDAPALASCPALAVADRTMLPLVARFSGSDLDDVVVAEDVASDESVALVTPAGGVAAERFLPPGRRAAASGPARPGDVGDWRIVGRGC